ncbi:MAG: sugar ABC transporter substrate-binding protein [Eubacteriales bacterium]|nr:sugar ABC transporter substrate-binding protein [Eubacteriales bacterium]
MNKWVKRGFAVSLAGVMALGLAACGSSSNGSSDKGHLVFQIWDQGQKAGMEAMAKAYMEKNPDVTIEVQATGWDEYWTKLEAAATSNSMPDIFWMHSNQIYKYADNGILADCSEIVDEKNYSEIAVENAKGSDGKIYGVPKDKDIIVLLYNKELFDAAGIAYPDENWTWDDMESASAEIYDKTGKYGYMAYSHDQLGYWNFVYQNGGRILNEDGTEAAYTEPATADAIKHYVGIQDNDWCPTQEQFANTGASEMFFSGEGAMYLAGNYELVNLCTTYTDMNGKWDVAMLPKCPDPAEGEGRASISNSVSYATAAEGKNKELAMKFLEFLASEEGQKIQGESGAAIPAYNGLEDTWVQTFADQGYELTLQNVVDMFDYSVKYVNNPSRSAWEPKVEQTMLDIYGGNVTVDEGIQKMQDIVTEAIADN